MGIFKKESLNYGDVIESLIKLDGQVNAIQNKSLRALALNYITIASKATEYVLDNNLGKKVKAIEDENSNIRVSKGK